MKTREARELGQQIADLIENGESAKAYTLLALVLAERTPFAMLRHVGEAISVASGAGPLEPVNEFLDQVAAQKTEGGWVVIASVLEGRLARDLPGAFERCQAYIIATDVWYASDTLGEGVVGRALVASFDPALELLHPWRQHPNPWVRRACGSGAHYWAKRSRGDVALQVQAQALLDFLEPLFEERDMIAVKGIGWGLKTLGRQYPDLVEDWLAGQVLPSKSRYRALMLRKALKYLPEEQRQRVLESRER